MLLRRIILSLCLKNGCLRITNIQMDRLYLVRHQNYGSRVESYVNFVAIGMLRFLSIIEITFIYAKKFVMNLS